MEKRHLRILRYTGSFSSQKQMVSQSFIPMISLNLTWTITFLTRQISCCSHQIYWMSWRSVPKITGISADTFSLDDPAVFNEIRSCRPGDAVSAVEGACRLAGIGGAKSFSEPLELLDVHDLRGLSRYHSMSHSTDLWDSNQKPLLGHGTIASEQLIMCREDVYRYLADGGIPRRRPPTSHVMFETVWVRDAVLLMSSKNYSKSVGQKIGL